MIKKIKASTSEKIILFFLIILAIFSISFFTIIKNKCLFVTSQNPNEIKYNNPQNIAVLNTTCGNVIIELDPNVSPNSVKRFKMLINSAAYNEIAFHRVIKNKLVQAGDLEFGKKNNLNYAYIGTGKSGYGTVKSEIKKNLILKKVQLL